MGKEEKTYLSKEKHKELTEELNFLKTERRKELADRLESAKALGDLAENAEYHAAREDQANSEKRIVELETLLKDAEVVEKHHSDVVEVGASVVVKKEGEDKKTFEIVGSEDADTSAGKISNVSPLGEALLGGKKGDTVSFQSPAGKVEYKIIEIE